VPEREHLKGENDCTREESWMLCICVLRNGVSLVFRCTLRLAFCLARNRSFVLPETALT